ncbi:MAG: Rid family detoxifying hydrolase [candidate division WOR-3 bacterium]|nr:Rid family detoxifying hydrolase [candidate division WOR-3 bacterium]
MKIIKTDKLPAPAGSYSQAVQSNGIIYISGQIALDKGTGELMETGLTDQTRVIMDNISMFLSDMNISIDHIVKVTVYMTDISMFSQFNTIYSSYFEKNFPARVVVGVSELPKGAKIEMEAIVEK